MPESLESNRSSAEPSWGSLKLKGWRKLWLWLCHQIPGIPWLRKPAMWFRNPLKKAVSGPVDAVIWGKKLRLWASGNLSEQRLLFLPQFLDRTEREVLRKVLHSGGVFLDIGANAGVYSIWAGSLSPSVIVEAFEPDSEIFSRLERNLKQNNLTNVHVHPVALGATDTTLKLQLGSNNRGENRILSANQEGDELVEVEVKTLVGMLDQQKVESVTAMKIDVEGHELEVLKPFFEQAPKNKWPQLVICELDRSIKNLQESPIGTLLLERQYQLVQRTRMNGIFTR